MNVSLVVRRRWEGRNVKGQIRFSDVVWVVPKGHIQFWKSDLLDLRRWSYNNTKSTTDLVDDYTKLNIIDIIKVK